jgi:NADP-dependent 3-hydroxy acid dehydrogenase YdfG
MLAERFAVVTGATSGVGRAIALALAQRGARLCAVGRNPDRLAQTVAAAQLFGPAEGLRLDLADDRSVQSLVEFLENHTGNPDILIHGAGIIHQGLLEHASIKDLDEQYAINIRAPYLLTQRLLPLLVKARGQIVFINSSVGLSASRPEIGQYAATKHALKAIADTVRAEANPLGVRVLSVYLGRTATAMQETLFKQEGKAYDPKKLLQPEDVASVVLAALALPSTAEVTDISIRPMVKG